MSDRDHMHHDHQSWSAEHTAWLDDLARWQREHAEALRQLDAIAQRLRAGDAPLATHAARIRAHETLSTEHEHVMDARDTAGGHGVLDRAMTTRHAHEDAEHAAVAAAHEHYAERHAQIMDAVARLYALVTK
ncbi:hypothetical protein [Acidihalobacter ferrooxydans]|uniref:Uncharacterized protein n=1 Tax=Acidihalobacter ferrooxydans TaxID=1765967 RepID=A0A1P8UK76_9GAMM|nr:hypothetical protein [Acidihalobacter ferrooxydans]APZ44239.1 hypothetical protein BW247_15020 [Acidihalobacter ferrooxydans]